jgi:hypothetical protein
MASHMTTQVQSQSDVTYAHVQEVMRLLPDAIAESNGGTPNFLLAAHGLTSATTGTTPFRFFCVVSFGVENYRQSEEIDALTLRVQELENELRPQS